MSENVLFMCASEDITMMILSMQIEHGKLLFLINHRVLHDFSHLWSTDEIAMRKKVYITIIDETMCKKKKFSISIVLNVVACYRSGNADLFKLALEFYLMSFSFLVSPFYWSPLRSIFEVQLSFFRSLASALRLQCVRPTKYPSSHFFFRLLLKPNDCYINLIQYKECQNKNAVSPFNTHFY